MGWRADLFQGKIFLGQSNKAQAQLAFMRVIQNIPSLVEAYEGFYQALEPQGYKAAIASLNDVLVLHPDAVPAVVLVARLSRHLNDWPAVLAIYNQGLKNNPEWLQGYKLLADEYRQNGNIKGALQTYASGLQKNPNNGFLLMAEAEAFEVAGDLTEAVNRYETLLTLNPNSVAVRNNLAILWVNYESLRTPLNIRRAQDLVKDFARQNNPALLDTYGWVLYWAGDVKAAEHALKMALEGATHEPEIAYHLAVVYKSNNKNALAAELLNAIDTEHLPAVLANNIRQLKAQL